VTGCLVPPADPGALAAALDLVASSAELRQCLGDAGRKRAEAEFDPQRTAQRYVELYRELATKGTLPARTILAEPNAGNRQSAAGSYVPQQV
jgi:glycogen synthase